MATLLLGHGAYHSHYVQRRPHPRFPEQTILAPACGSTVAGFEVNDAGDASCGRCKRAATSPRVRPTLLLAREG